MLAFLITCWCVVLEFLVIIVMDKGTRNVVILFCNWMIFRGKVVTHSCTWGCYRFTQNFALRIISFTIHWTLVNIDTFYIVSALDCRSFRDRNKFYEVKLTTILMIGHRPSS